MTLDRLDGVEHAVFVGDTPYDVEAASRAGLGCLALLTGGSARPSSTEAGALLVARFARRPRRHRLGADHFSRL